jgi:Uncharacterized alpha/beta hydrolase domain (DUF2235)
MTDEPLAKTTTNSTPDSSITLALDVATANVFFDGTMNNIFNTNTAAAQKRQGHDSYFNAATNVALMWQDIAGVQILNPVYIDGIGTTRNQVDSPKLGGALGVGETGIETRAQSAFTALDGALKINRKKKLPVILNINVFGFSRGAATARHFVHLVNSKQFYPSGWDKMRLRINFVGLFDTVSAFGIKHSNDVTELHLNFGENYAQRVVHLIAGDEYRDQFEVTTIASAGDRGYELTMPGAHSDVGGSYLATDTETRSFSDPTLRQFVYDQGWYTAQDAVAQGSPDHRRVVLGEYSRVAHSIMVDKANDHLKSSTYPDPLPAINADVKVLQTRLRAFAKDDKNTRWDLNQQMSMDRARAIRRTLFHVSFQPFTVAHDPHMGTSGQPERQRYAG